jgi:hypothetical protein
LLWALPAASQIQIGDVSSNLNGYVSAGYAADYGNEIESDHGLNVGGSATASGYYYSPNFVSFNLTPYYGQSRANSNYQSITDSSGVNLSTGIFSGSHFPGSINYAAAYNSDGQFAVPGLPNYTTHGNSDTFGINWSEFLPGWPTLTASFQRGSNQYSVYGLTDDGNSSSHSLTLGSNYAIAGFHLSGSYTNGASNALLPEVFQGEQSGTITSDISGFGFSVSHSLPLNGNFSNTFYRSDVDTNYFGYAYKGNFYTEVATASMQPTDKLHVTTSASYTDNLAGVLYGSLLTTGSSEFLPTNSLDSSHAWDLNASGSYSVAANMSLQAQVDRRQQDYLGEDYGETSYSAGVAYSHSLLGGSLNTALSVIDSKIDNSSENGLGFSTNANYTRTIGQWVVNGSANYAQNVSTLLITYTTSYYSFSGGVRRRWRSLNWNAGASVGHSGLTYQPGTDSSSQSYTSSFGYGRWITLTGNYGKSNGVGLITPGGILPVNISPILPSNLITLYGGTGYGVSLSSSPEHRLVIAASYAKSSSNTSTAGIASANQGESKNVLLQYQFRKMYLTGGYANLSQGFSASGLAPSNVSSFYIGVSRWFNFF